MDILQIALVFLIVVLGIALGILGVEVYFILKELRKNLNKLDLFLTRIDKNPDEYQQMDKVVSEKVSTSKMITPKVTPKTKLAHKFLKKALIQGWG